MADEEEDKEKQETNKNKPQWKETCLGIWTKGTRGEGDNNEWICNGISVVKIDKNINRESIKMSKTRGLQVIIQETDDQKPQKKGDDRQDRERDPQHHVFPPENPGLGERLMYVLKKKKETMEKNVQQVVTGKASFSDVWAGFSGLMVSWYQTSHRIVSYCKPKEKIYQMYNFASSRVKDIGSHWRKKK